MRGTEARPDRCAGMPPSLNTVERRRFGEAICSVRLRLSTSAPAGIGGTDILIELGGLTLLLDVRAVPAVLIAPTSVVKAMLCHRISFSTCAGRARSNRANTHNGSYHQKSMACIIPRPTHGKRAVMLEHTSTATRSSGESRCATDGNDTRSRAAPELGAMLADFTLSASRKANLAQHFVARPDKLPVDGDRLGSGASERVTQ